MIILNLKTPIKALDGSDIRMNENEITSLAKSLANLLIGAKTGPPLKMMDWALALWKDGEIVVDKSDFDWLKNFIENNQEVTVLLKAQLLRRIEEQKEKPNQIPDSVKVA